jgi:hypothetical protein
MGIPQMDSFLRENHPTKMDEKNGGTRILGNPIHGGVESGEFIASR